MQKSNYQKLVKSLGFLSIGVLVFVVGAFAGSHESVAAKLFPTSVTASDETAPAADLAEFWKIWHLMEDRYPFAKDGPSNQERIYGAIQGMVGSYGDPYTVFFPPKEAKLFNEEVKGSFGGVGMEVGNRDGFITVIAPLKDSHAEKAGIKAGDIITEVDGKSTDDMDVDSAISLIRGDVGTSVTLKVLRVGEAEELSFTIVRAIVHLPVIDTKTVGNVFVISLYSFSADSTVKFKEALEAFNKSGKTRLVIDLRGNPGGYLDAAVDIASYFLPAGKTIVRESSGVENPEIVHQSKGFAEFSKKVKIVVLVDKGSASASEILAGALSEHGVAKLVGTTTYGKGSVQELIDLKGGSSVKITVAKWLTPKGVSISEKGIVPEIVVKEGPTKDAKTGVTKDPQLDAAIKAVQ